MNHRIQLALGTLIALSAAACIVADEDADDFEHVDSIEEEVVAASAARRGTCSCNPPPDNSGKWSVSSQSCSLCSTSGDCATAKCHYVHSVHGETEQVGCQFSSGTAVDVGVAEPAPLE